MRFIASYAHWFIYLDPVTNFEKSSQKIIQFRFKIKNVENPNNIKHILDDIRASGTGAERRKKTGICI